ncbi:hypothetical protein DBR43_30110 [Pedobacter sp. KBW06]|uniref:hypothetical protein n=1 Tax=Pedobacter sp. KBW06 TaxID=2153359 RepID=UPI000F5B7836|nr:hypothetical protein [Pedobacter sp. KBW06]RQO66464.1 hypothetical protein DBR43_30110 [Pedobacter sp. KBW06]
MEYIFTSFLIGTGACLVIILTAYFLGKYKTGRKVILQSTITSEDEPEGFSYYYLPSASLSVQATARIILYKSVENGIIIKAELQSVTCEATVKIEPDTSSVITLSYLPDFFFSDQLKVLTNERGLLQNVETTSGDKIVSIVEQFTAAPAAISPPFAPGDRPHERSAVTQGIKEEVLYTRTFFIPQAEIDDEKIERKWLINFNSAPEVTPLDASFSLNRTGARKAKVFTEKKVYKGIYTRPVTQAVWDLEVPGPQNTEPTTHNSQPVVKMSCLVPDSSRLMKIPIQRALFVESTVMPKFSDGLLVENAISKPSGMAELSKIPINILKALVSVPAQLLQFKIIRTNLDTNYEKSIREPLSSKEETRILSDRKNQAELKPQPEDLKQRISELPEKVSVNSIPPAQQERIPKLGKLPPEKNAKTETATRGTNIREFSIENQKGDLRTQPPEVDWSNAFKAEFSDYQNYELLTCVPAAAAYLISIWSANTKPKAVIPSEQSVIAAYRSVSGYNPADPSTDVGCKIYTFLKYWRDTGIGGDKLEYLTSIKTGNISQLKSAVYWCGGCIVGLQMPASAKNKTTWSNPTGTTEGDYSPGSWGGHAVAVIGYNADYLIAISCGQKIFMTYPFFKQYTDESFIALSATNWFKNGKSPTNPGLTLDEMNDEIQTIRYS